MGSLKYDISTIIEKFNRPFIRLTNNSKEVNYGIFLFHAWRKMFTKLTETCKEVEQVKQEYNSKTELLEHLQKKLQEFNQNNEKSSKMLAANEEELETARLSREALIRSNSQLRSQELHLQSELNKLEAKQEYLKELENQINEGNNEIYTSCMKNLEMLDKFGLVFEEVTELIESLEEEKQNAIKYLDDLTTECIERQEGLKIELRGCNEVFAELLATCDRVLELNSTLETLKLEKTLLLQNEKLKK